MHRIAHLGYVVTCYLRHI